MLTPLRSALFFLFFATEAFAAHGNYAEAMRVRSLIARTAFNDAAETIKLPVSRGFDQGTTALCWAYATLSALETNYRARHPGSDLELSRRTMQRLTVEDRWLRKIRGIEDYITERGVAVDAVRLIRAFGLVSFDDFADITDPYGRTSISQVVGGASSEAAKIAALGPAVDDVYGVPPVETRLGADVLTRDALREAVFEGGEWESYAIARDGREGYRTHPDPDHRGQRSYFMPVAKVTARIKEALATGFAVEITIGGHCILIYGASYDASGAPASYFIKDSYPPYFYEADAGRTMASLVEMTTASAVALRAMADGS